MQKFNFKVQRRKKKHEHALENLMQTPTWSEIGYPMNCECFLTTSLIFFSSR